MATAQQQNETTASDVEKDNKKLHDIFVEGWNEFEQLEVTNLPFNSKEFQV